MLSDVFFVPMRASIGIPPEAAAVLIIGGIPLVILDRLVKRGTIASPAVKKGIGFYALAVLILVVVVGWGDFSLGSRF